MALWTPEYLDTALWLDAADSATITLESNKVSEWRDKSGNSQAATQSSDGNRPLLVAEAQNGKSIIRFDGSTSRLIHSYANVLQPTTIFALVNVASGVTGYRGVISTSGAGSQTQIMMLARGGTNNWGTYSGSYRQANSDIRGGAWQMLCMWRPSLGGTYYRNGVSDGAFSATEGQAGHIGGFPQGGQEFNGDIAEIIVLGSATGDADRKKIEGYLAHKWGLAANLPADHLYKADAPTIPGISGTVTGRLGQPCQRKVYAISRPTDTAAPQILAHGLSDPTTGDYELIVPTGEEVTRVIVSEDDDPLLNDIVHRVIPA
jgi:hypothetical protein